MYCLTALKPNSDGFSQVWHPALMHCLFQLFTCLRDHPKVWVFIYFVQFFLWRPQRHTHTEPWCSPEQAVVSVPTVWLFRACIQSFIKSSVRMWRVHRKQWQTKKNPCKNPIKTTDSAQSGAHRDNRNFIWMDVYGCQPLPALLKMIMGNHHPTPTPTPSSGWSGGEQCTYYIYFGQPES